MRGNLTITETFTYDGHGRLTSQSSTGGQSAAYSYGNRSRTTVIDGRSYTKTYDAWGSVKSSGDPVNTVQYTYHSSGQPKTVTSAGATFSMTYDGIGNQTTLTDPNAGTTTYTYDAAGQARTQTAGNGAVTLIHRDRLGRDSCIIQGNIRTAYTYGTAGNATGRLTKLQTGNNYAAYTYDQYGRPMTEKRNIDGAGLFELSYAYNSTGQLQKTVYPGGIQVGNEYDAYGNLMKVLAGTQPVWELAGETGTLTTTTLGGSMTATETFNAQGQLASLKTVKGNTQIRNMNFEFFAPTGNLTSRTGMIDQKEGFFYDDLDRLIAVSHEKSGTTNTIAVVDYADNGNINEKTGLGEYTYADTRPHAVEYLENTDLLFSTGQKIDYNAFRKATVLKDTIDGDAFQMDIAYGPDEQRWKTVLQKNGSVVKTVIFAGDYERITEDGITKELIYLPGGGIYVRQAGQADKEYYAHTDHLGSIISITDGNGNDVFKASYDAWGRQTITNNTFKFHRGYTGHEHLPEFGLINMNGRMYDPIVGRFLSPDPYVQMPDFSQSFNRYSYCINNPLIYTDPTGEVFGIDDAIFILASMYMAGIQSNFFHAAENGGNPFNPGNWNWNSPWTYVSIAAGGFSAYAQTLEHCEYAVDLATGKKFFMSHKGEGIQDYLHYGRWVDNHSAFITDYTVIKDIALGGVDNIRNLASGIYTGQQAINMAAGTVRMSRHEQIMSNPVVQSIHRAQGEFWSTIGSFINSVSHGVLNPDHIPQYVGGTAPIPGRFRGGGLLKGAAKTGTQTVYKGVDAAGKVRYVGRTGRDAAVRFGEHARSGTSRSLLDYRVVETGLTTPQARIWEQNMINSLGLQKNGGQLFNQINSIAPKYWWQYGIK
jgi:RHS repeat-associated protein